MLSLWLSIRRTAFQLPDMYNLAHDKASARNIRSRLCINRDCICPHWQTRHPAASAGILCLCRQRPRYRRTPGPAGTSPDACHTTLLAYRLFEGPHKSCRSLVLLWALSVGASLGARPQPAAWRLHSLTGLRVVGLPVQVAPLFLQEPTIKGSLRPHDEGV